VLALSALSAHASEPEGRIAFRYQWVGDPDAPKGETRHLRLSITPLVPLTDARIDAESPSGANAFPRSWSAAGIALDGLAVGAATVIDLEVVEPKSGGEILTFSIRALDNGLPVRESVGIAVGTPGVPPTLRNGAAEYPAVRDGTQP
jgi:hypothetical protein